MSQKSILSFFKQTDKSSSNQSCNSSNSNKKSPKSKASSSAQSLAKSEPELNGHSQKEDSSTNGHIKSPTKKKLSQYAKKENSSTNGHIKSPTKKKLNECAENDSPIKKTKKRKARAIIESDEESNNSENEISDTALENKTETEKMDVDHETESNMKNCNEESTQDSTHNNNSETESKPSKKRKKNKKDETLDSVKKIEVDNCSSQENQNSETLVNGNFNCQPSTSSKTDERISDKTIPPKRKTARKSIMHKKQSPKKLESPKSETNEMNEKSAEGITDSKIQNSDSLPNTSGIKENNENRSETSDVNKSEPDCKSESEIKKENVKTLSSKKSQVMHPFFAPKNAKEKIESSTTVVKIENESSPVKNDCKQNDEEKSHSSEDEDPPKEESSPISGKPKKNDKISSKKLSSDKESKSANENSDKKSINTSSTSSGIDYDPSKSKYHPINDACWKQNEKVPYLALAKTLELIEKNSGRLKIVEILSNFFRSVIVLTPSDLLQSVYLCLNRLAPEYEGIELGIGDMLLMKAVAQATGRTLDKIRAEVKEKGDLGLVAESSRGNQKVMIAPPKLTVASVFTKFKEIAKMTGNAVMAKKTDKIQVLFVACRDCEAKFIIRSLSGKLRIGLAEQSVLAALSRAAVMTPPGQSYPPEVIDKSSGMSSESFKKLQDEKTLILKTTYCECPNFDLVIPVLLKEGIDGLPKHCQLSPGCPLKPMLAHPTNGIEEVLRRFDNNEFTCEFKYDGERAQIHRTEEGDIKIFSRNQEDNTSKYPDIIARLKKSLKESTKSFILDTEAVAWDNEAKQILPFQILSTRKKKDAVESEIVVQVCVMAFDLLYLNGESLVKKPLKERRQLLHSSFNEVPNEFMFVIHKDGNSAETMQEFLDESIKGNCEGLMVKALKVDASYEIAKRSHNWLKLKKDYLEGVGDTLDLVVIGGYHGKGKRTGTYGGFLLACYDVENEEFQSICKLGTGFKDDMLEAHTKFLKQHVIASPKSYYRYDHSLEPDEWFEPEQIWEVKCADLSVSPIHKAAIGIVDPEKGISLRFPRFIRIREDKKVEQATSSSQIAEMYQNQEQVQNMKTKAKTEEDYY